MKQSKSVPYVKKVKGKGRGKKVKLEALSNVGPKKVELNFSESHIESGLDFLDGNLDILESKYGSIVHNAAAMYPEDRHYRQEINVLESNLGQSKRKELNKVETKSTQSSRDIKLAELGFDAHTVQTNNNNNWQNVGKQTSFLERPATRHDILVLERKLEFLQKFLHPLKTSGELLTKEAQLARSFLEEDMSLIQSETNQRYSHPDFRKMDYTDAIKDSMNNALFEQKWVDLILGDLQQHIAVSFAEKGHLLGKLRIRMGSICRAFRDNHNQLVNYLSESFTKINRLIDSKGSLELQIKDLIAQQNSIKASTEKATEARMYAKVQKAEKDAESARQQQERLSKSLSVLQGMFQQFRNDSDAVRIADLRDTLSTLERKCQSQQSELETIRPNKKILEAANLKIEGQEERIARLEEELAECQQKLAQRDALCEELMAKESKRLSAVEVAMSSGLTKEEAENQYTMRVQKEEKEEKGTESVEISKEKATVVAESDVPASAKVTQQQRLIQGNATGASHLCAKCRVSLEEDQNRAKDGDRVNTGKREVACKAYRLLLPNLMGYRPQREKSWTIRRIRIILRAKQRDDALKRQNRTPAAKFPVFVWSWFQPRTEAEQNDKSVMYESDENRWALYYGCKALSKVLPEARLFYNFLDEKYGEDELSFYLHSVKVLDVFAQEFGGSNWGSGLEAANCSELEAEDQTYGVPKIPEVVFVSMAAAKATINEVMKEVSQEIRTKIIEAISEKAVPSRGRLPKLTPELRKNVDVQKCVEAGGLLRRILQQYRQENGHRKAAIQLMFRTAQSSVAQTSPTGDSDGTAIRGVDLQQFFSLCKSLNADVDIQLVAAMYKEAYEDCEREGNIHGITYDAFLKSAEKFNFFTSCLRLPYFVGAVHTEGSYRRRIDDEYGKRQDISRKNRAILISLLHTNCSIFFKDVQGLVDSFNANVKSSYEELLRNYSDELNSGLGVGEDGTIGVADGRRALCAYRRLLMFLLFNRMLDRESYGEIGGDKDVTNHAFREIKMLQTIILDFAHSDRGASLNRLYRYVAATRLQRSWRAKLKKSKGPSLQMRLLMSPQVSTEFRNVISRKEWLNDMITDIYYQKIYTDAFCSSIHRERPSLRMVIMNRFMSRFGVRQTVDIQIHDFYTTLRSFMTQNARANMFGLFCGLGQSSDEKLYANNERALDFYIRLLLSVRPTSGPGTEDPRYNHLFPYVEENGPSAKKTSRQYAIPLGRGIDTARRVLFSAVPTNDESFEKFTLKLKSMVKIEGRSSSRDKDADLLSKDIPLDKFLRLCMSKYIDESRSRDATMRALFNGGEIKLGNVLNLVEFEEMLNVLQEKLPSTGNLRKFPLHENDKVILYHQVLQEAEPSFIITQDAIMKVIRRYYESSVHVQRSTDPSTETRKKKKKAPPALNPLEHWEGGGAPAPLKIPQRNLVLEWSLLEQAWIPFSKTIPTIIRNASLMSSSGKPDLPRASQLAMVDATINEGKEEKQLSLAPSSNNNSDKQAAPAFDNTARRSSCLRSRPHTVTDKDYQLAVTCLKDFEEKMKEANAANDTIDEECLLQVSKAFRNLIGVVHRLKIEEMEFKNAQIMQKSKATKEKKEDNDDSDEEDGEQPNKIAIKLRQIPDPIEDEHSN
eukprot:g606.t1